jgi:hypothetical protein
MENYVEYQLRQNAIERSLTAHLVKELVLDNRDAMRTGLENPLYRTVVMTFASTASLLRRVRGDKSDNAISIEFLTMEDAMNMNPNSKVLKKCKPSEEFCVIVATWLPVSALGLGPDQLLTHSTTGFKLNII